jgi:hypothetical protein
MKHAFPLLLALFAANLAKAAQNPPGNPAPSVGIAARIDQLVLPGSELEVVPIDDHATNLVVRIAATYVHGNAFRYDIVYYGLEPGDYDLRDYLRRKDGSGKENLPAIPVTIKSLLPPGQIQPNALKPATIRGLGGYQLLLEIAIGCWIIGLAAILLYSRRKKAAAMARGPRPVTLADRLKPLVEGALAGNLNADKYAELERLLISFWTRRMSLGEKSPAAALAAIRQDSEGGALLRQLEVWLHQPPAKRTPVDIHALLEPYRSLPADPEPAEAAT